MKRYLILFVAAFIIISVVLNIPCNIFADNQNYAKVHIDGQEIELPTINVVINGQVLESDVPPIVYNDRTLVPIRFVAEYLNADVEWIQEQQEAIISGLGKEIILKPNSSDVKINGITKKLPYDVPAKVVNDGRTMVPLRFVTEELGCRVEWKQEEWTAYIELEEQEIIDVKVDVETSYPRVIVKATGPVMLETIELEELGKLVIDMPHTLLNIEDKSKVDSKKILSIEVDKYPIEAVRSSQFGVNPNITRLVVDMTAFRDYEINYLEEGKGFEINLLNTVSEIKEEQFEGKDAIVVKKIGEVNYNTFMLEEPNRIVVDLLSSRYQGINSMYELNNPYVKTVRVAEFAHDGFYNINENVVRVVLDIKEDVSMPQFYTEISDGDLLIFLEGKDFEAIKYHDMGEGESGIEIEALNETEFNVSYHDDTDILEIRMPKDDISISDGTLNINDDLIESVTIFDDGEEKVFNLGLKGYVEYSTFKKNYNKNFIVVMESKNKKYKDKLIIIDAGHGGKDPGAKGVQSKVTEKELNLLVAKRLNKKLREIGFETLLVREKDEYIGLYERAEIANKADGDAFISIHFNAHNNPNISGIETIYCPAYASEVKTEDNYPFASTLHYSLLEELGSVDRGIDRRPEIVVTRETKMVAALLELGFMSNPEEEMQILTFDYIDKAIEGISKGLMKYFDE